MSAGSRPAPGPAPAPGGPRVVSLLPSATEVLCAIGANDLLVGRSHECDWPAEIADRPVLTGQRTNTTGNTTGSTAGCAPTSAEINAEVSAALKTGDDDSAASLYTLDTDTLRTLAPDVILTQDLCEVCSIDLDTVRAVAADLDPAPTIVSLDPHSIEDVFDDLLRVGEAIGREPDAHHAMIALRDRYWTAIDYVNPYERQPSVAFLEWMDPLFAGGHWTPQLIEAAGGAHPLNAPGAKSRAIDADELVASRPERLIVCPCGYDLAAIERELATLTGASWWSELPAVKSGHVALVDGNQMFNRPGPRLVEAFRWLVAWLNDRPEVWPEGFPVGLNATAKRRA